MKILGKELLFNGNKVYHAGDKPTAAEIGAVGHEGIVNNLTVGKYLKFADYDDGATTSLNTYLRDGTWVTNFTGLSLNGNISYSMFGATRTPLETYGGDKNGHGLAIGSGGATIVGAGESKDQAKTNVVATTEKLYLTSDQDITLVTAVQNGWDTRKEIVMKTDGELYVGANKVYHAGNKPTAADVKALPLTGGTLTGRLTANGKITLSSTGGQYITGKTLTNASLSIATPQTSGSYHPLLAVETNSKHVINLGGIRDEFGFYGYYASRTDNGTDWYFKFNSTNGSVQHSGVLHSQKFVSSADGSSAFLEKWYTGGKTARIDYYQNPNRLELFWSATNNGSDWSWANTIYFDENGTVKAKSFNVNGCRITSGTANTIELTRPDGAEYAQVTCRSINIGAYSGVTRKLSIETSAPSSPKTGDVWIQV